MAKRMLIAVENDRDRMDPVIEVAGEIAGALDAEVVLFHTYTDDEFKDRLRGLGLDSADPVDVAKRNETTRDAASSLSEYGCETKVAASVGDPADEIAGYVREQEIDHVFLGARQRSATGKAIFGSVSQSVITSIDVPCTVLMQSDL